MTLKGRTFQRFLFGFGAKYSTETALRKDINGDKKGYNGMTVLDLRSAYRDVAG